MDLWTLGSIVVGLVFLVAGAELLVRGASRLAAAVGISPLVVGLTVVAYGTSAPELAVSLRASLSGSPDIAVANVVGSNVFNVLFILGVAAAIAPLVVDQKLVRREVPLLVGVSFATWVLALDGAFGRAEGTVFALGAIAYTVWAVRESRSEDPAVRDEYASEVGLSGGSSLASVGIALVGLGALVLGARWLVDGAIEMATAWGVEEAVIGLTIVAAGTSLPELATSVVAAVRGARDIAIGNVVGSNLFNLLFILGVSGVAAPEALTVSPGILHLDLPIMVAVAVACLPVFFTGHRIDRWEAFLFLGAYVAYTTSLVLTATDHSALPTFNAAVFVLGIPLVLVTLAVGVWRTVRA